jgi:hypothetical protein
MASSESFQAYSTRSCTLQSILNFDLKTQAISDFDLAESMTLGSNDCLQSEIHNHQILLQDPFNFGSFENRESGFWDGIIKRSIMGSKQRLNSILAVSLNNPQLTRLSKEEFVWRIHSFLDSQGKCPFCKKQCGSVSGKCAGPIDKSPVEIPPTFVVPPKPKDYQPPRAMGLTMLTAGKPILPPAGRAPNRSASVAEVREQVLCPDLDAASVLAFAAIDEELRRTAEDRLVSPSVARQLVIRFKVKNHYLLGLIDTGAEINLINDWAVKDIGLPVLNLVNPT